MRGIVERKQAMLKRCYGLDLSGVAEVVYNFEQHEAKDLIDAIQAVIQA